jgi:hypothetical protein
MSLTRLLSMSVIFAALTPAAAQEGVNRPAGQMRVSGTVREFGGPPVAGAKVDALNLETRASKAVTTDVAGQFIIEGLPAGKYRLRVSRGGAASSVIVKEVDVEVRDAAQTADISLGSPPPRAGGTRCTRIPRARPPRPRPR